MAEWHRKQAAMLEFLSARFADECVRLPQGEFQAIGRLLPIKEEIRTWNAVRFSGFKYWSDPRNPQEAWVGRIYGQRSDGQFCYVAIVIGVEDAVWAAGVPEAAIEARFRKALEKFQGMRDCSCGIVGYRETGEVDDDGDPIVRPIHNECRRHLRAEVQNAG